MFDVHGICLINLTLMTLLLLVLLLLFFLGFATDFTLSIWIRIQQKRQDNHHERLSFPKSPVTCCAGR